MTVDGYFQSGEYMRILWKQALTHIATDRSVPEVLLLGLGAGSAINEIHSRFPEAAITVIEWDQVMVDIFHRLQLCSPSIVPTLLIGDAIKLIPSIERKFDLVLIDLFKGDRIEPRLSSTEIIDSLANCLTQNGQIILNAFKSHRLIESFSQRLNQTSSWSYRYNRLALFQAFTNY